MSAVDGLVLALAAFVAVATVALLVTLVAYVREVFL